MDLKDKDILTKFNRLLAHFHKMDRRYSAIRLPLRNLKDVQDIPISRRDDLIVFAKRQALKNVFHVTATSGTTDARLLIARSKESHDTHIRRLTAIYKSIGVSSKDFCLNLCSYSLNSGGYLMQTAYEAAGAGVVALGSLDTPDKIAEAVLLVRVLQPTIINSYTNQLFPFFSRLGKEHNIQCCVVNGEPLFPFFKKQIEKMSGVLIHDHYGAMEISGLAIAQKPNDEYMRVFSEGVFLEILQDDGSVKRAGRGALLVTDLENTCMPFIRYQLGDRVELVRRRGILWIKVLGRLADSLLINGEVFSYSDVVRVFQEAVGHPEFFLMIEKDPVTYKDRILLNLLSDDDRYHQKVAAALKPALKLAGVTISRFFKGNIPKMPTGKFRHIIDTREKRTRLST